MSQSPDSKNKGNGPSAESKVTAMQEKLTLITQLRLAGFQQLQADLVAHEQQIMDARKLVEQERRELRRQRTQLRKEILRGAEVETGPLQAFTQVRGRSRKRRTILTVK